MPYLLIFYNHGQTETRIVPFVYSGAFQDLFLQKEPKNNNNSGYLHCRMLALQLKNCSYYPVYTIGRAHGVCFPLSSTQQISKFVPSLLNADSMHDSILQSNY